MSTVLEHIQQLRSQGRKGLALLIDPDKTDADYCHQLAETIKEAPINLLFVGGSLVTKKREQSLIEELRTYFDLPIVLFPGSVFQIDPAADALLFLSLISGRNPEMLIGKHVEAAPLLKGSELEVIPTGYMLVESGTLTTAHYMSGTLPIPHNKPEVAMCTALAGELLGLKLLYLDGGSGAKNPVSVEMIQQVRGAVQAPLIVGGGIRSAAGARKAFDAGADLIVVGTAVEEAEGRERLLEIALETHQFNSIKP